MSAYDRSGEGQKERIGKILERMGFKRNLPHDEWLIEDEETQSMVTIVLLKFHYAEHQAEKAEPEVPHE